jgi:argininosuccinate lyase
LTIPRRKGSSNSGGFLSGEKMNKKLWGGAFRKGLEPGVESFSSSISFDIRLAPYDIAGSIAHAKMLASAGIISEDDGALLVKHLESVLDDISKGKVEFTDSDEDIHLFVEKLLGERAGDAAGKLHSGRSRNDQVALDIRLFLKDRIDRILELNRSYRKALLEISERNIDVVMPGFTHMQHAQPVLFPHHMLAYFEMAARDAERLADCRGRVDSMPLGSGALAGSSLPLDREYAAKLLGFSKVSRNSMDAVSDRDFIIEFLSCCSILMMHLSRLSEEIILWLSPEFNFITIDESVLTGSSMMPQKKNPDVAELIRGKTGRVYGSLTAMLTIMKGLPLAYNRDMQEDKIPLFDACDTVESCLAILPVFLKSVKLNRKRLLSAAGEGFTQATDLAEYLVEKGAPFRKAHKAAGRLIGFCISNGRVLNDLTDGELSEFGFSAEVRKLFSPEACVISKKTSGGTSASEVRKMILGAKENLDA